MWGLENKLKMYQVHRSKKVCSWGNTHLVYTCTSLFSCLGSVSIHIVADPGRQKCCADTCTCESFQTCFGTRDFCGLTQHCKHREKHRENMTFSLLLCMFFSSVLSIRVSLFGVGSFNRLASFPLLCTAANCWHILPMSSAWSEEFSLSPSRMTSSCVTSRQCVLCCVSFS